MNRAECLKEAEIKPIDVAHMMILLKIARAATGKYKSDNYVDIAGYAACAAEIGGGEDEDSCSM